MSDESIKIVKFAGTERKLLTEALKIREAVFILEQNVPRQIEVDGLDSECTHVLAWVDTFPAAAGRFRKSGNSVKIERIAVLPEYRSLGLGRQIMEFLASLEEIRSTGSCYLHAQSAVVSFYEKLGYKVFGAPFYEADIEHFPMRIQFES